MAISLYLEGLDEQLRRIVREELAAARSAADGYLDVDRTAKFLATTPTAIRSMVGRGELPVVRTPNGRLLFEPSALRAWAGGAA